MASHTSPVLLDRIRDAADPMAWQEFFARYWPAVFGFARRRGCSDHTAEEVVQDVMLTVFRQRDVFRYDPARGRFRDWLHRITHHRVAERRRGPAERARAAGGSDAPVPAAEDSAPSPDEAWETAFEQALLTALLDVARREFSPREFVAFELTALRGDSPANVARVLGITRNMVYKARRQITERLTQLAGEYRDEGNLCDRLREALAAAPEPRVVRAVSQSFATRRPSCQGGEHG